MPVWNEIGRRFQAGTNEILNPYDNQPSRIRVTDGRLAPE
eukprot:CAMPEP_0184382826 /NCGR_PEP_ID=MMETSP0007-20130409/6651_1 /TAXON_ID=97485 /ORGANISM="Prymnesium parvum, Strain Texoma1" /LENGTH=39 /DNA_ID= /DNA_START= /DNA_END= /DNA_ORIENTATION=